MTTIARLDRVTKRYRLGSERSNWRALVPGPFGDRSGGEHFLALDDVSFAVNRFESVGILGENGAGKSTLLKVLAGIIRPTVGNVVVTGRVASVIELGVGFNPEFTGEDNLVFAGALHGMSRAEVEAKYDDIVEFAGLDGFMDMPVKRYSTGMRARLGFALVTSFDSDLIILDEVLSVGDWNFQQKCLARVRELKSRGAAVVTVSHSSWLISQICERAVLMEHGRIVADGDPLAIIERYIGTETITDPRKDGNFAILSSLRQIQGTPRVSFRDFVIETPYIQAHEYVRFRATIEVSEPVEGELVFSIYTMGRAVFSQPEVGPSEILAEPGMWEITVQSGPLPFSPGMFGVRLAAVEVNDLEDPLQEHLSAFASSSASFKVLGEASIRPGLQFETSWSMERRPQSPLEAG